MQRQVFIEELEIRHCLGCEFVQLKFACPQSTYFIMTNFSSRNHNLKRYMDQHGKESPICIAIKLICSEEYASVKSLSKFHDLNRGVIKLSFLIIDKDPKFDTLDLDHEEISDDDVPCTSRAALERQQKRLERKRIIEEHYLETRVVAKREFYHRPENICYRKNGGKLMQCSVARFHGRFFTTVTYILPELRHLNVKCKGNWLQLLKNGSADFDLSNNSPIEKFVQLYLSHYYEKDDNFMPDLTHAIIEANNALFVKTKQDLILILNSVRDVFEFITCDEYTVWFVVPTEDPNDYIDVNNLNIHHFNFEDIKTFIQLKHGPPLRRMIWTDVSHEIQDLLLIAFQLGMAAHAKQKFLFLNSFTSLQQHIALQLTTAAFIQQEEHVDLNWTCQNYMQQIITVCNSYKITAILDYPSGLPLPLGEANIIKCRFQPNGSWLILDETRKPPRFIDTTEEFLEIVQEELDME